MSLLKAPSFKPFTLALIQLGNIGANKPDNLKHAHEMIRKASGHDKKPDLIVLPVCARCSSIIICSLIARARNVSTHHMDTLTSLYTPRRLVSAPERLMTLQKVKARASRCSPLRRRNSAHGSSAVLRAMPVLTSHPDHKMQAPSQNEMPLTEISTIHALCIIRKVWPFQSIPPGSTAQISDQAT